MALDPNVAAGTVGRDIGGLALSCVDVDNPMATVRAATWRNTFARVGMPIPWFAIHDLGMLLTTIPQAWRLSPRSFASALAGSPAPHTMLSEWTSLLEELSKSEVVEKARSWRLSDDLVAVVLLRVMGPLYRRFAEGKRTRDVSFLPLDPGAYEGLNDQLPTLFRQHRREEELRFLNFVTQERLRVLTAVEQIDLDTLRLLGLFGEEAGAMSALSMLDLLSVLGSSEANDIVNFSLDLLPSILETKRSSGEQTMAVDGYAGFARRGALDSLVLSELAYDNDLFDRRFVENEVFYYAREKAPEVERTVHYICVDASASMRGKRATFARGLALTLMKKFALQGDDVVQRYFDSRLYEPVRVNGSVSGRGGDFRIAQILSFVGERGRHYARVFAELANDVARLRERERVNVVVYIVTHAECHIPAAVVETLRQTARLYGIFMLPSTGSLDLDYVSHLDRVQVVDEAALSNRAQRNARALQIIDDAAKRAPEPRGDA